MDSQLKSTLGNESRSNKASFKNIDIQFEDQYSEKARKDCMFYQDNPVKEYWDICITILLLFSCMLIPYRIAFVKVDTFDWRIALAAIDGVFGLDLIFCFFNTYLDEEFNEIDDRK